jgi:hypothetical protein
MTALVHGKWVVDPSWVRASQRAGYWVDEREYEFNGDTIQPGEMGRGMGGPRRARQALTQMKKPPLLSGYNVALLGEVPGKPGDVVMLLNKLGVNVCEAQQLLPTVTSGRRARSGGGGAASGSGLLDSARGGGGAAAIGKKGAAPPSAAKPRPLLDGPRVVILDQRRDALSNSDRNTLEQLSGKVYIVGKDWLFDTISTYEVQRPEAHPPPS